MKPICIIDFNEQYVTINDGESHYCDTHENYALDKPQGAPDLPEHGFGVDVYIPGERNSLHHNDTQTEGRQRDAYHDNLLAAAHGLYHNKEIRETPAPVVYPPPRKPWYKFWS